MKTTTVLLVLTLVARTAASAELHVSFKGSDRSDGSASNPLKTISAAARLAQPGDVITVHEGTYRERVAPPRRRLSEAKRIVYQAAPGEKVTIKGSEAVKKLIDEDHVWKVVLPNSFFGSFNPYSDLIHGDWFNPLNRQHHTGAVYLNGDWLAEAAKLDDVMKPAGKTPLWFGQVDRENTTIWAQFPSVDPNGQLVEINVRRTVFYPEKPGMNFITIRGFTLCHAATPWAPPTAEQVGLIGTHWSKGWVIENNIVSHSICSGIALGKYGDQWDNTSANTAEGYVKTIERALKNGWNKETIGHHVVRKNTISHCEQAGIVGSLGAAFSTVTGNTIHDIHVRRLFSGAEMAGIKFHAAIDVQIVHNQIHHTCRGLWLDWMAQGTRVSRNLFYDNAGEDVFVEVDHGPFLFDNNLLLSGTSLLDMSEGGAYVHNLFAGRIVSRPEPNRQTPYHPAHSTAVAGLRTIKGGDDRYYNNIFVGPAVPAVGVTGPAAGNATAGKASPTAKRKAAKPAAGAYGLSVYDARELPLQTGGNVYCGAARPYAKETDALVLAKLDPQPKIVSQDSRVLLTIRLGPEVKEGLTKFVTTELLGKALIPGLGYETADGSPLVIDADYSGEMRNPSHPSPGPFENPGAGDLKLRVW